MYLYLLGTPMGTKCLPPYACLAIGYLGEIKRFTNELPKYIIESECTLIMELLKHYMDNGFIFRPLKVNLENFKTCLNNMYPSTKFTSEKPEVIHENGKKVQVLNLLDVKIILSKDNSVETNIYYKPTNSHDYLPYDSAHLGYTKNNIHYSLARRITVLVSNLENVIIPFR